MFKKRKLSLVFEVVNNLPEIYSSPALHAINQVLKSTLRSEEKAIYKEAALFSPKVAVHIIINNISASFLESGNFHLYRGILNPVGDELLIMFEKSYDLLNELEPKEWPKEEIEKNKSVVRNNIKHVG